MIQRDRETLAGRIRRDGCLCDRPGLRQRPRQDLRTPGLHVFKLAARAGWIEHANGGAGRYLTVRYHSRQTNIRVVIPVERCWPARGTTRIGTAADSTGRIVGHAYDSADLRYWTRLRRTHGLGEMEHAIVINGEGILARAIIEVAPEEILSAYPALVRRRRCRCRDPVHRHLHHGSAGRAVRAPQRTRGSVAVNTITTSTQ